MKRIEWFLIPTETPRYDHLALQEMEPYVWLYVKKYQSEYSSETNIPGYDVNDLAQELRLHLWRKIDRYNPRKASPKTWASMVMSNKIIDILQSVNKKNRDVLNHPDTFPFIEGEEVAGEEEVHWCIHEGIYDELY